MEAFKTKELDPMQLQYSIVPELGHGYGRIKAINRLTEGEAEETAREVRGYIEQVETGCPCGCIDGRCVLRALNGKESKLGPKTAGGSLVTTQMAMELDGALGETNNIYEHTATVINLLENDGQFPVRFHIDADHEEATKNLMLKVREDTAEITDIDDFLAWILDTKLPISGSGCGMNDQGAGAIGRMGDRPRTYKDLNDNEQTETDEQVTDRLAFMKGTTAAIHGEAFDEARFDAQTQRATKLADGIYKQWDSLKALLVADRVLMDRGVEDGALSRIEVLGTSSEGVHGHIEDLVIVQKHEGATVNQTKYFNETGKQVFTYDEWIAPKIARTAAAELQNIQESINGLHQAITSVNLTGAYQLTDGSQGAVIYS